MAKERIVVGIDVGTTKVCALIGEIAAEDQIEVIGVGVAPSRGLRKGIVVNADEAAESIEQQSGFKIVSAYVGIAGAHIQSVNSRGVVAVRRPDKLITQEDVTRVLEAARLITIPPDREIIHIIARHFIVDGQEGVRNPVGMLGHRVEVEANIVTGALTSIHNLTRCVERLGISVDELVLQPLAAGEASLTEAEREVGVIVVDIGGGTTDVAVFTDGAIAHAASLPVGGNHLSNDLAIGLRLTFPAAEEIKLRHGAAVSAAVTDARPVEVGAGKSDVKTVSRRMVAEILEARLAETFDLVVDSVKKAGFEPAMPAGVVLTGGTAQLDGIRRLAAEIFDAPVRIGTPNGAIGLVDQVRTPPFSASLGLLKYGYDQLYQGGQTPPSAPPLKGVLGGVTGFLRSFFP